MNTYIFLTDILGRNRLSKYYTFSESTFRNKLLLYCDRCYSDNPSKPLEYRRMFLVGFSIPDNGKSAEEVAEFMYPLMTLVFYWLEKIKRFRLSKEVGSNISLR